MAREPSRHDDIVSRLATREEEGKSVQRARKTMRGLMAIIAVVSSLTLLRCSEDVQPTAISDVRNHSFTFSSGAVFHAALANMSTTLSFLDTPPSFMLSSAGGTAGGLSSFAPCILTVASSEYASGTGPQMNDVIRLNLCDVDTSNDTLIVGNGTATAISAPGVPF